jgi:GAF domain-containing protein/HAMP domain-containing protein
VDPDNLSDQLENLFSDLLIPEPEPGDPQLPATEAGTAGAIETETAAAETHADADETQTGAEGKPAAYADDAADDVQTATESHSVPDARNRDTASPVDAGSSPSDGQQPTAQEPAQQPSESSEPQGPTLHWRSRLTRRLVVAFLAAALLPALIIAIFAVATQLLGIRANVLQNLELVVTLQENQIRGWVESQQSSLSLLAREPDLLREIRNRLVTEQSESDAQRSYLSIHSRFSSFVIQHPEFQELFLLDATGKVVATTDSSNSERDETGAPYFTQGLQESYYGPPVLFERLGGPYMVVAEPLRFITGDPIGVLVGLVKPGPLGELTAATPGVLDHSETYLVGEGGTLVTALGARVPPGALIASSGVESAITHQTGRGTYNNYAGTPVLGAYRWLPGLQMGLIAELPVTEAYSSLLVAVGGILIVAVIAVALTALLSGQMAQRIARPIIQITEAARQMVAGDLYQTVETGRDDEIGVLGQAFNHMAEQLRMTIAGLEETVHQRTQELQQATTQYRKRATHLETGAEVSRAAASILEPEELMRTTVELIRSRFSFDHVSLFLVDKAVEWAVVVASTGDVGRRMVEEPHRLRVGGGSMVGWVCAHREPRVALDVGADAVHFDNPLLPDTRSELAMPLLVGNRLLGALDVQSTREAAFDSDDIRSLRGMADLIAIALQNARRFVETQRSVERQKFAARLIERFQQARGSEDVLTVMLEELGAAFALDQAVVCVSSERPTEDGNGSGENTAPKSARPLSDQLPGARAYIYTRDHGVQTTNAVQAWSEDMARAVAEKSIQLSGMRDLERTAEDAGPGAGLTLPILIHGQAIGALHLTRRAGQDWRQVETETLTEFTERLGLALEAARLAEEKERRTTRERRLAQITTRLRETLEVESILQTATHEIRQSLGLPEVVIHLDGSTSSGVTTPDRGENGAGSP